MLTNAETVISQSEPAAVRFTDPWLKLKEAAAVARCSEITLRRAIADGYLRCGRINPGQRIRIRESMISEWLSAPRPVVETTRRRK